MQEVISKLEAESKKAHLPDIRSGDTVRVHQKIWEGKKERIQVFEGTVIRTRRANSLTAAITVRRVTSGIGVEKTYFLHSPNISRVEITKRGRVRRNYLTYLRKRQGKATRLTSLEFDKEAANKASVQEAPLADKAKTKKTKEQPAAQEASSEPKTATAGAPKAEAAKPADSKKAKAEAFRQKHEQK